MDWIEQLFGIDPDFGSGSLEMLIAGAIAVVVVGAAIARRRGSVKQTVTADEKVR